MGLSAFYIILASSIWWIDWYVRQGTPFWGNLLIALETSIAGILLILFLLLFKRNHIQKIKNVKALIGMILLGGIGGSWCFAQALAATQSLGFVFVLIWLQPIFTIITSSIILGEHPRGSFYAYAGTAIFASIILTVGDTWFSLDSSSLHAYIYALLTAIFWGAGTTFSKIVVTHNSHLYALALRLFFTGFIGWIIVFASREMLDFSEIVTKVVSSPVNVLFLIFISDLLGYGLYYRSLRDIPATIATMLELTFPLTGFVIDYILYEVTPSPMKVVAALVILMSIVILPHCHFIEEKKEECLPNLA